MKLDNKLVKKLKDELLVKKNVVGISNVLQPRIRNGKQLDELCVRVYVSEKLPASALSISDIIPSIIKYRKKLKTYTLSTDVVEVGEIKALAKLKKGTVDKTAKFRPVELGVSIGHYNITAGSLGFLAQKDGKIYAISNAHVLTPDPALPLEAITEKRIVQPGPYHDSVNKDDNVVGMYVWHKQIKGNGSSTCPIANTIIKLYNTLASLFNRKTRLTSEVSNENYIDAGAYEKKVEHLFKVADNSIDTNNQKLIGLLFAGSDNVGIICKVKYIMNEGYIPLAKVAEEVNVGDKVIGCSFWCNYTTKVIDTSAMVTVSYGYYSATFNDVIIVENKSVIKGGWSGSSWWLV